jgi:hypothetical protein
MLEGMRQNADLKSCHDFPIHSCFLHYNQTKMMHASVSFAQKEVLKEDVPIKLSTGTKTQINREKCRHQETNSLN